jgi:nucleoside-diphosphate-sugar epimerase
VKSALITGGSGFFGELLKKRLLKDGVRCVNIDLEPDETSHPSLTSVKGDIRDAQTLDKLFEDHKFDAVFHCAAILGYAAKDKNFLWSCNVDGTRNIAEWTKKHKVPKLVYTSTCCLWAHNCERPIAESDEPNPIEPYGQSKWEGEKILHEYKDAFDCIIIRTPTIIERGRLGLLAILFEFIDEGRKVWVVGGGNNRYQFVDAQDLIDACLKGVEFSGSDTFNVGSDDVKPFREVYDYVIRKANTGARVANLPRGMTLFMMKVAYALGLSPLGPYQYKMIAESFMFDTSKIKAKLNWKPTATNEEMLYRAYEYYHENRKEITGRTDVSAHKQPAKMGVIKLLKWLS